MLLRQTRQAGLETESAPRTERPACWIGLILRDGTRQQRFVIERALARTQVTGDALAAWLEAHSDWIISGDPQRRLDDHRRYRCQCFHWADGVGWCVDPRERGRAGEVARVFSFRPRSQVRRRADSNGFTA
jgi:hypothetical protein